MNIRYLSGNISATVDKPEPLWFTSNVSVNEKTHPNTDTDTDNRITQVYNERPA